MAFNGQGPRVPDLEADDVHNHGQHDTNQYGPTPNGYSLDYTQPMTNGHTGSYFPPYNVNVNGTQDVENFDSGYALPYDGNIVNVPNFGDFDSEVPLQRSEGLQMYMPVNASIQGPGPSSYLGGPINIDNQQHQSVNTTQILGSWNGATPSTYVPESAYVETAGSSTYQGAPLITNGLQPYDPNGTFDQWLGGYNHASNEEALNYNTLAPSNQFADNEGFDLSNYANAESSTVTSPLSQNAQRSYRAQPVEAEGQARGFFYGTQGLQDQASVDGLSEEDESEDEPIEGFSKGQTQNAAGTTSQNSSALKVSNARRTRGKKGSTRHVDGRLEWFDPAANDWKPAVIHHDIRPQLQRLAQQAHRGSSYNHPDANNGDPFNDTSFFPRHQSWGPERADRPEITWRWEKGDGSELPADQGDPGWMMFEGKIVLDPHDNPIKDYWNIPAVLSPWTEGYKLEAMSRENARIAHSDFWARMPREYNETVKGQRVRIPLSAPNARVNMPMTRFRLKAGCQSWVARDGTQGIKAGLLALFAEWNFDPVASGNSTKGFGRDLAPWEREQVKLGNVGRFGARAGGRALDPATRAQNLQEKTRKITEKKASSSAQGPGANQSTTGLGGSGIVQNPDNRIASAYASYTSSPTSNVGRPSQQAQADAVLRNSHDAKSKSQSAENRSEQQVVSDDEGNASLDSLFEDDTLISELTSFRESTSKEDRSTAYDASLSAPQSKRKRSASEQNDTDHDEGDASVSKRRYVPRIPRTSSKALKRGSQLVSSPTPAPDVQHTIAPSALELSGEQSRITRAGSPEKRKRDVLGSDSEDDLIENDSPSPKRRFNSSGGSLGRAPTAQIFKQVVPSTRNLARPRQPKPQHSLSRHVPPVGLDYREVAPSNEAERRSLDEALAPTREAYFEWTGHEAPVTNRNTSYMEQYKHLCECLAFECGMQSIQPTPHLVSLPAWASSISNWPPHIKDDDYYEAWRFGHRAPRTADGILGQVPGHLLERLAKEGDRRASLLEGVMLVYGYIPNGEFWEVLFE